MRLTMVEEVPLLMLRLAALSPSYRTSHAR